MTRKPRNAVARVTYRATLPDGREADLELALDPETATVADAWRRLTALYGAFDPRTIEVEIRRRPSVAPFRVGRFPVGVHSAA